jgi:hypothetical protein
MKREVTVVAIIDQDVNHVEILSEDLEQKEAGLLGCALNLKSEDMLRNKSGAV